jgi:hypothetical protein
VGLLYVMAIGHATHMGRRIFGVSWRISFPGVFQRFPVTKGRENGRENLSQGHQNPPMVLRCFKCFQIPMKHSIGRTNVMIARVFDFMSVFPEGCLICSVSCQCLDSPIAGVCVSILKAGVPAQKFLKM